MISRETRPFALGEGYIMSGVTEALATDVRTLDDGDRESLNKGIAYWESTIQGRRRMLRGPFDSNSVTQSRRIGEVFTTLVNMSRAGLVDLSEPSLDVTVGKLESYAAVLARYRDNILEEGDEVLIAEQKGVVNALGWVYTHRALAS